MEVRTKVDALQDLGEKVTGKTISKEDNETVVGIIDKITDNYEAQGGGTEVVANPTLSGAESNLIGLLVGDTKYKIPDNGLGEIIDDNTRIDSLIDNVYKVIGSCQNLYYNNSGYFEVNSYVQGNELGGLLVVIGGGSFYLYFEVVGTDGAEAKIHWGATGKTGSHSVFTIPED